MTEKKRNSTLWVFLLCILLVFGNSIYVYRGMKKVTYATASISSELDRVKTESSNIKRQEQALERSINGNTLQISRIQVSLENSARPLLSEQSLSNGNSEEISILTNRISNLEAKLNEEKPSNTLNPLILAVLNLKDRVRKSLPYKSDLKLVKKLSEENGISEDVKLLSLNLQKGVVTIESLKEDFQLLAKEIVKADKKTEGFIDSITSSISNSISIRRIDGQGSDTEIALARVESQLKYGNLKKAVATLKKLSNQKTQEWIEKAERLLEREDIFNRMVRVE